MIFPIRGKSKFNFPSRRCLRKEEYQWCLIWCQKMHQHQYQIHWYSGTYLCPEESPKCPRHLEKAAPILSFPGNPANCRSQKPLSAGAPDAHHSRQQTCGILTYSESRDSRRYAYKPEPILVSIPQAPLEKKTKK